MVVLLVVSQSLTKAATEVAIITTFSCNGAQFYINSVLVVPTDYPVDPRISSIIQAVAPLDPGQFLPSIPVYLTILNPLYFEGTTETAFHTG